MKNYQIGVVVGSIRKDSINKQLANGLIKLFPKNFSFKFIKMDDLPLYNQDLDGKQPEPVNRLKKEITDCDALIFLTPEYNRSMPGVLKNALDHGSRPYGQNSWANKPAGVLGASVGTMGTALAQQHLRNVLAYLDTPTLNQPEVFIHAKEGFFDKDGHINDTSNKFLQGWVDKYMAWVENYVATAKHELPKNKI